MAGGSCVELAEGSGGGGGMRAEHNGSGGCIGRAEGGGSGGIGRALVIEGEVKREKVAELVKVLMEGGKGKEMRKKALEWKRKAHAAAEAGGSSHRNLDFLINQILLKN